MASDGEISCTNDPNFAVIYSFLKVFGKLYSLEVPTIAKLQESIENTQEVSDPLKELHLRLLRRALKSVQTNRWERSLIKFCHQQSYHQEAWELERFSYKKASTHVKLRILKLLLEYQFTCHPKFKNAVNSISCKELRLDPIGRDKNGCVYWLQVDHQANLCLYKEDQDEETWQLIASNREELVKIITQLKTGEEVTASVNNNNEDSNSGDATTQKEAEPKKTTVTEEENEEEFLSPESESEHDSDDQKESKTEKKEDTEEVKDVNIENVENKDNVKDSKDSDKDEVAERDSDGVDNEKNEEVEPETENVAEHADVGEAIEEPVMIVTGEGNGEECESSFIIFGEEISEPVMYIYGEGWGADDDTGNPEAEEEAHSGNESDEENPPEECNGESYNLSNKKAKIIKGVKLKNKPAVNKRSLKKQPNDVVENSKSDCKKHCIRDSDKSIGSNSSSLNDTTRESSVNDKSTTDGENKSKKKVKSKVKKKQSTRKVKKIASKKALNSHSESDNCQNSKVSIIEKRKSSLSSDQGDENSEQDKGSGSDKETKHEDLPPKKIRLEPTPDPESHSKETDDKEAAIDDIENDDTNTNVQNETLTPRKKIKAIKGKFKAKRFLQKQTESDNNDKDGDAKTESKAVKRSLMDANASDKTNESQSETEEEDTGGKRLKIKPKKINTSTRKKVEAKHMAKSSSESEEETLSNIGKKPTKKVLKKKPKDKGKSGEDEDCTPVRQSRRIAQMKIKEEAERRHAEEIALREMKMIHKKKVTKDDEDWQASSRDSSESEARPKEPRRAKDEWREGDSSADLDSEPDSEPLFEHDEPDLVFTKSDHEFSPESDLEDGEPSEPVKRARTLQENSSSGSCARCGSAEQPEWILLCDRCDAGYHASCLKPVLLLVPEGDWFCPACSHIMLISSLEKEIEKYDSLLVSVEEERAKKKLEETEQSSEIEKTSEREEPDDNSDSNSGSESASGSAGSSSGWSSPGAVYRLRARRQLPVSYRAQEYDRLISSAIKEEYVEPTTSAGNQGRGKDISTIIEAAEEEKMKAEREAVEQGKPVENKKTKKKQRRKPRKLNSLDVPSEDDETDEDFKDTGYGMESSSEEISSSAERDSSSHSSDSLPIRRKDRAKQIESSPEVKKKKKGVFDDSSSESGAQEKKKSSRPKGHKKKRLTQYDSEGNVIRARVTYGSPGTRDNDWSPKHRTRQKKINYTEMPNTESEDEMHKSSGKHLPDSSDEFQVDSSGSSSSEGAARDPSDERARALSDLVAKTAVVPLTKLPDDVTSVNTSTEEWCSEAVTSRGRGRGRGRGSRGPRGRGRGGSTGCATQSGDDALSKLVGVKIKELRTDGASGVLRPNQAERDKKRQEREAKLAEKEAKKLERIQKKEEKEKLKEQKAKEREEKRLAKIALQESKKNKKEKDFMPMYGMRPQEYNNQMTRHTEYQERFPPPRLQVRPELRGMSSDDRSHHRPEIPHNVMREGTLSVAGSPQPFAPAPEEPSVITRMPHVINYRGQMMYPGGNSAYGPRGQPVPMYQMHPGLHARQYPPYFPHLQPMNYRPPGLPGPPGPPGQNGPPVSPQPVNYRPPGPPSSPQPMNYRPHGPNGPPSSPQPMNYRPHGPNGPPSSPQPMNYRPHGPNGPPSSPQPMNYRPHGPNGPPSSPQPMNYRPHGPNGPPSSPQPMNYRPHGPNGPPSSPQPMNYRPHGPNGPPSSPQPMNYRPHGPNGPPSSPQPMNYRPHGPPSSPQPMNYRPHGPNGPSASPQPRPHGPPMHPHGPPVQPGPTLGPPASSPHPASNPVPRGPSPGLMSGGAMRPGALYTGPGPFRSPPPAAPPATPPAPEPDKEPPVTIKAEVKTEPEYSSPPPSPTRRPSPEPPRNHPKIKHTENKDGRPRFPLGPYAPHYGPYGPYAPSTQPNPQPQDALLDLQTRIHHGPMQRMPASVHQYVTNDGKPVDPAAVPTAGERFTDRPHEASRPGVVRGPPDRPMLHDMLRPPAPERIASHDLSRGPDRPQMHDLSRLSMPDRPPMHDPPRPPGPERLSVHDMSRLPGPERAMMHDMQRSPGSDRLMMLNMHRLSAPDRPMMHDMHRPPGPDRPPMHDMHRPPGPDRPPMQDMHRLAASDRLSMHDIHRPPGPGRPAVHGPPRPPGPERPAGPERPLIQVPAPERLLAHEVSPHYPYMRARAGFAPERSSPPDAKPAAARLAPGCRPLVKLEAEVPEGGVFGGLVSYFSSQREDDVDS